MYTQKQIIANLIEKVGGFKKIVEITGIPQSRYSEWLHEKSGISLIRILEICKTCNVDFKKLL